MEYCERWDPLQQEPVTPLTEAEARRRYAAGPTFTVLVPDEDDGRPAVVLEVDAGASRVVSNFHGVGGALEATYLFRRRDGRLFLEQIDVFAYEGDELVAALGADLAVLTAYSPADVVRHEQLWFRPDGFGRRTVDTVTSPSIEVEDCRDVPVEGFWTDVPTFGDWTDLARWER